MVEFLVVKMKRSKITDFFARKKVKENNCMPCKEKIDTKNDSEISNLHYPPRPPKKKKKIGPPKKKKKMKPPTKKLK